MFARYRLKSRPTIPDGHRVYAIGDIHGQAGLLRKLLQMVKEDNAQRSEAVVTLVFLGDIVDRGPDSAALLKTFARMNVDHVVVLKGNHEEALVQAYHGDYELLDAWIPFGAEATLAGFGIRVKDIDLPNSALLAALQARIDADLIDWLEKLRSSWSCGDYYFAHAGIRPGVALKNQKDVDLFWIREPFLSSRRNHGKVIVHGHTVNRGIPRLGGNRIGIDTGAHEHGVLTGLRLEGEQQSLIQASVSDFRHDSNIDRKTETLADNELTPDDRMPMLDIVELIKSIVSPSSAPPDVALLLTTTLPTTSSSEICGYALSRQLGRGGYVAAGFALGLALLGGTFALNSSVGRSKGGSVNVPLPVALRQQAVRAPEVVLLSPRVAQSKPLIRKRRKPRIREQPAVTYIPASNAADGIAIRLYGAALAKALEEDRAITRELNLEVLENQQAQRDVR